MDVLRLAPSERSEAARVEGNSAGFCRAVVGTVCPDDSGGRMALVPRQNPVSPLLVRR